MTLLGSPFDGLLAALLGLIFGSFAGMLSHRLPRGDGMAGGRSGCPSCGAALQAMDLIPLFSWVGLHGRCRHCGEPIGLRYPLIELASCLVFVIAWLHGGFGPAFPMLAALGLILIIMSTVDLEHGYLPDPLQLAAAVLAPGWWMTQANPVAAAISGLVAAAVLGGAGWAIRWAYYRLKGREGFGLGDVKLMALAGFWLGLAALPIFLVVGGLLGLVLALLWRAQGRGLRFPLGPALALSFYFCLFFPTAV